MQRGSPSSDKGHKLYVGGLLDSVRKQDINDEFGKFGELRDVWVARNPPGFAFVEFTKNADAERAVRALDGMNVCGSRIRVEFANVGSGKGAMRRSGSGGRGGSRGGGRGGFRGNFNGNGPMRNRSPGPMYENIRRGRSPPPHAPPGYQSRNRNLSPRPRSHRSPPRGYGYDMPGMYPPPGDASFPYGLPPGYPMMPFLPPEDILRSLRGRSPMRGRSPPPPRRRSRSPIMMDRRRGGGGPPGMMRDRSPPPLGMHRAGGGMGRRGPPQNGRMSPPPMRGPRRMSSDRKRSPLGGKPRRGR